MILEKAYYQQNFQVGQFLFTNYGLGAFIEEGETHQEVYAQLKERVYAQFRSDNPHLQEDYSPPIGQQQPDYVTMPTSDCMVQRDISDFNEYIKAVTPLPETPPSIQEQIQSCKSPTVLKIYKNMLKTESDQLAYDNKMDELLNAQIITNGK